MYKKFQMMMIICKLCMVRDILIMFKSLVMNINKFGRCVQQVWASAVWS